MNLSEEFKRIFLAGIGAAALTAEKSKEVIDEFVKKGELTIEQGKVLNEELKRNVKEKVRDVISNTNDNLSDLNMVNKMDQMSDEQIQAIKDKIAELERQKK